MIQNFKLLKREAGYSPVTGEDVTFLVAPEPPSDMKGSVREAYLKEHSKEVVVHVQYLDLNWGPNIVRVQGYVLREGTAPLGATAHYDAFSVGRASIGILQLQSVEDD